MTDSTQTPEATTIIVEETLKDRVKRIVKKSAPFAAVVAVTAMVTTAICKNSSSSDDSDDEDTIVLPMPAEGDAE